MAHFFGAMPFPAAAPGATATLTDPGLDVVIDYVQTVLETHLAAAWSAVAPGEPIVRKTFTHKPVDSFHAGDLPALYCWREKDGASRVADAFEQTQGKLRLMWVYPPTGNIETHARRSSFLNGFAKVIHRAVYKERDPAWVHADDAADVAANMYGSSVLVKAGFDWWQFEDVQADILDVETERERLVFPMLIAEIDVRESEQSDPAATNREPTALELTIKEEGVTAQHEIEPDP